MRAAASSLITVMSFSLTGCGTPPAANTTFLRSVDLVDMTEQMSRSFAHDPRVSSRTIDDPEWVVSINRVANQTNQIIPDNEKWAYVGRLRAKLAESDLSRERSIVWVVPPERWPLIAKELGEANQPVELRRPPTHVLTAEFHALTNTSGRGRSDAYVCDYQLVDLSTGSMAWEDAWEVKRAVSGKTYD
jgi:hypothetical protein